MLRSRLLPWLFSAGLFLAVACSDAVSPKSESIAAPTAPSPPTPVALTGIVHLTNEDLYPVELRTGDGQDIRLTGQSAYMMVSVDNAEVEVRGQWETDASGFFVADFLVRAVNGNPVIDGTLVALYPTLTDSTDLVGYAIRPTRGGSDVLLSDPSPDLLSHLNQRIWIAGVDGGAGAATAFGVITEM